MSTSSTSQQRVKDETKIELPHLQDSNYAIWISFAEIYNENIYDLFEKLPVSNKPGEKPQRRSPLKLADDKNGVYIKGLKEVAVANTDEAYQLLQIGRNNLKFAATRLNHHSSRSHCIFTIKGNICSYYECSLLRPFFHHFSGQKTCQCQLWPSQSFVFL